MHKIQEFRMSCQGLLSLMEIDKDTSFGSRRQDEKKVGYKENFYYELSILIDILLDFKEEIKNNYSKKYLGELLEDFLFELKFEKDKNKIPAKIDEKFKNLNSELSTKTYTFLIPLLINKLKTEKITIGNVTFVPFSQKNYESIFTDGGYKGKDDFTLHPNKHSKIGAIAFSEISAGDEYKAVEKTSNLIEQSLNVIRLYEPYYNFGITGIYNEPKSIQLHIYNKDKNNLTNSYSWNASIVDLNISKKKIQDLEKNSGLNNINTILKKPVIERTDMENKLLLGINLFGEILKNRDSTENIIRIFIALETLLIGDKNEEKRINVAERLSYINHSDEKLRIKTFDLVERLYNARSKLVHAGKTDFKEIDFNTLFVELQFCIITIAKLINKYSEFKLWIDMIQSVKFKGKLEYQ